MSARAAASLARSCCAWTPFQRSPPQPPRPPPRPTRPSRRCSHCSRRAATGMRRSRKCTRWRCSRSRCASSGELFYDAPDRLEKRTLTPSAESLVLDHGVLTAQRGHAPARARAVRLPAGRAVRGEHPRHARRRSGRARALLQHRFSAASWRTGRCTSRRKMPALAHAVTDITHRGRTRCAAQRRHPSERRRPLAHHDRSEITP